MATHSAVHHVAWSISRAEQGEWERRVRQAPQYESLQSKVQQIRTPLPDMRRWRPAPATS